MCKSKIGQNLDPVHWIENFFLRKKAFFPNFFFFLKKKFWSKKMFFFENNFFSIQCTGPKFYLILLLHISKYPLWTSSKGSQNTIQKTSKIKFVRSKVQPPNRWKTLKWGLTQDSDAFCPILIHITLYIF